MILRASNIAFSISYFVVGIDITRSSSEYDSSYAGYFLIVYIFAESVSFLYIQQIVKSYGCRFSQILGSFFMLLQVFIPCSFLDFFNYTDSTKDRIGLVLTFVGAFLGGFGFQLSWAGNVGFLKMMYAERS